MTTTWKAVLAVVITLVAGTGVHAATPISFTGTDYVQNFNLLPSSGTAPTFTGIGPHDVPNLDGWSFLKYAGTGANALFNINDGASNSGSLYSYGLANDPDRALGALASGTGSYMFGAAFTNTTGSTLTSFTFTYTGEQWRNGQNSVSNTLSFSYALGATDINTGSFLSVSSLDFTSLHNGSVAGVALDGNNPANQSLITFTVSNIIWEAGTTLTFRWSDIDNGGSDNGLAVDNLTFAAIATPFRTLVWNAPNGNWNTTDANWSGEGTIYQTGDIVEFTDTAVGTVNINAGAVTPLQVRVTNTAGTYTFQGGAIEGGGSLVKSGNGTLELVSEVNLATGVTIEGGTVVTKTSERLNDGASVTISGTGVLDLEGNTETIGALTMEGGSIAMVPPSEGVDGGLLVLGGDVSVLPSASGSVIEGRLSTGSVAVRNISVANGAAAVDLSIDAFFSGTSRLAFSGAGTTELLADNSSFGAGVTLNGGELIIGTRTSLGTGSFFFNGGKLTAAVPMVGDDAITHSISMGGNTTVDATNAMEFTSFSSSFGSAAKVLTVIGDLTISGSIGAASVLNKGGEGILTLTAANTYTGATTVQAGTLRLTGDASISTTPSIRVDAGATLDASGLNAAFVIARTESVTQVLRGGGIVIAPAAGIRVDGALGPGGTAEGFLTQTLTIQGGALTLGSDAALTFEIGGSGVGNFDQLVLTGGLLTIDGTLTLSLLGGFVPAESDIFTIINSSMGATGAFDNIAFGERITVGDGSFLVTLDGGNVVLSQFVVPEPGMMGLLAVGGLVVLWNVRRRRV